MLDEINKEERALKSGIGGQQNLRERDRNRKGC